MTDSIDRPYKCTVHLALPSTVYAQHLKDIMSVDQEISNKVVKSFAVVRAADVVAGSGGDDDAAHNSNNEECDDTRRVLQIKYEAVDAKMLRVSISTTYDMINVALKCFQEFGEQFCKDEYCEREGQLK